MRMPPNFSWVVERRLAGLGHPYSSDDIAWLRAQGIEILISLTETPPPRKWLNDAGLMHVHLPVADMTAPDEEQFTQLLGVFERAARSGLGVAVHCAAGRGRTGVVLAAELIRQGMTAHEAMRKVRTLRPGSIETMEQEEALVQLEKKLKSKAVT
jgi:atypical dual specificity phosphatase